MNTQRSTIGLVAALSVLLIALAFITKEVLDVNTADERIRSTITVSGMEVPGE